MPESDTSSKHDPAGSKAHSASFIREVKAFLAGLGRYAKARIKLFQLEAAEAAEDVARRVAMLVIAGVLLFFGYILLLAGLIGMAEFYREGSWPIATLILCAVHVFIGLPLLLLAKKRKESSYFSESRRQSKLDQEWLNTPAKNNSKPKT